MWVGGSFCPRIKASGVDFVRPSEPKKSLMAREFLQN